MSRRTKHTHKYIRQQLSQFNKGWRCALNHCDHFLPRNVEDTIEGRMSICWECSEVFRLDYEAIKDDMPKCLNCRVSSMGVSFDELGDYAEQQLIKVKNGVKDTVEVISEDDTHLADCNVYNGGECTCR